MKVLYYTGGVTGSGHLARGAAVGAGLKRTGADLAYSMISVENEYASLAGRLGFDLAVVPGEDENALGPELCLESRLFKAIAAFAPDVLVVDLYWFPFANLLAHLPCRKVLLLRQIEPRFFRIPLQDGALELDPSQWDLILRIEPGFDLPFPSREIAPVVIRNRDEIKDGPAARADLGLGPEERTCLFAFNGKSGEGAAAWKSWSYLEDEGWKVVRSENRGGGLFPAVDWFNAFDMVVCGAGYNAFWETRYFKKEAYYVPFERRFESQARRAALFSDYEFEANGADALASLILGL